MNSFILMIDWDMRDWYEKGAMQGGIGNSRYSRIQKNIIEAIVSFQKK